MKLQYYMDYVSTVYFTVLSSLFADTEILHHDHLKFFPSVGPFLLCTASKRAVTSPIM